MDMNTITTIIALFVVIPFEMDNEPWDTPYDLFDRCFDIIVHMLPFIAELVNWQFLTDSTGYYEDCWTIVVISILYYIVNFSWTMYSGKAPYAFMDWDITNPITTGIEIFLPIFGVLVHFMWAFLS